MAATDEIAEDAETPPHVTTDEDVTAGPSGDHRVENPDTSGSPQARSVKRKRKRVRQLLSSSSEDEEEVKIIKRRGKKRKEDVGKKQKVTAVKCRLKNIRPAPLSVAAQLDEEDKVSSWLTVSRERYKQVWRDWTGESTPLQVELREESGSEEEDEESSEGELPDIPSGGAEGKEPEEDAVNFSIQDEIIELLDSNDEEEYKNSQMIEENLQDLESDRNSPETEKDWISISGDESSDFEIEDGVEQVEENLIADPTEDEDEIKILNESQNSLYYKISQNIKTEPDEGEDPSLTEDLLELEPSSSDEEFLQSEREFFHDVKSSMEGADEKMVIEAYRKLKIHSKFEPDKDDVFQLLIQEVEDSIIRKLSKDHSMSATQVKILLLDLKGDNKDAFIREVDLKRAILVHKESNSQLDDIIKESSHSPEKVRKAFNWLKSRKMQRTKANVVSKLAEMATVEDFIKSTAKKSHLEEYIVRETVIERINADGKFVQPAIEELLKDRADTMRKIESIKVSVGCSEELARKKLSENNGDTDSASEAAREELNIHRKSKELAEKFKTSVTSAKEKLIDAKFDKALASQALEEENSQNEVSIEELIDDNSDDAVKVEPPTEKLVKSEVKPAASFIDMKAERKRRLKELAEPKILRREVETGRNVSSGIMKTSVPKMMKLSMELQNEAGPSKKQENSNKNKRERHGSDKSDTRSKRKLERSNSGGFLEEEAKRDNLKEKKEKFKKTADGYKTPKKLSVHNVDYNIMSQDISNMPVPNARPFTMKGMKPKKKKLRWKDENGFEPLVDVREIEADNRGVKCGPGNKDREIGRSGNRRKPVGSLILMEDVFKVMLDWRCVWLDEQKRTEKPPPNISGHFQVHPLLSTFKSMKTYVNIFIPLMIRGNLTLNIYLLYS